MVSLLKCEGMDRKRNIPNMLGCVVTWCVVMGYVVTVPLIFHTVPSLISYVLKQEFSGQNCCMTIIHVVKLLKMYRECILSYFCT